LVVGVSREDFGFFGRNSGVTLDKGVSIPRERGAAIEQEKVLSLLRRLWGKEETELECKREFSLPKKTFLIEVFFLERMSGLSDQSIFDHEPIHGSPTHQ
jgi:hypothetical protein